MKGIALIIGTLGLKTALADVSNTCGFAPLCGEPDREFDWENEQISDNVDGVVVLGAELAFTECCKLTDTQPVESCEIVDPAGESYRTLSATSELCGNRGEDCEEGSCRDYQIIINPAFSRVTSNDACCSSCTCFGDPQCISFDGEEKIWALCDGREVPPSSSNKKMCWITEEQCAMERDHAGNECQYLSDDPSGKGWKVGMLGSPCQPHPDSPPSIITMYEVPDVNFKLSLEQAERGVIKSVILDLDCGTFELSAIDCLTEGEDAWTQSEGNELPEFFSYNDVVSGFDEHWTVVDPDSGISMSFRCHGNRYEGDDEIYVPRINVEDVSDPVARGEGADGFCVSGEFDVGQATTSNTDFIFENDKCVGALAQTETREIFQTLCQNEAIPASSHESCIYHFCNRHFLPQYESIDACVAKFDESLAEAFCAGVTYSERDTKKCEEQWFDIGAVETIQQYYDDEQGCTTNVQTSLTKCQDGIIIQYFRNNEWTDEVAIPSDFCNNEPIILSYCDHADLFDRNIRILQKTASSVCGPVNQCTQVVAFTGTIELLKTTPYPTTFPTVSPTLLPTVSPTSFPTQFPSNSPTPFPVAPTTFPTQANDGGDCDVTLCDSPNENVLYENNQVTLAFDECCVEEKFACTSELNRTQTAPEWYCGHSDGAEGSVADSLTGEECEDRNELHVSVMFSHSSECCKKCTCFGDPRCYSFDGSFDEFVLCDGRTPGETPDDRCIIRKNTCEEQVDHAGNACVWSNPLQTPPDLEDPLAQAQAERQYSVLQYGSPCRYDENVSPTATIVMYDTPDPYRVEIENGERGYIQAVHLTTFSGEFKITSDSCIKGDDWEVMDGSTFDMTFTQAQFGQEYIWSVEDKTTKIIIKIRCTGHIVDSKFTTTFINVESISDWDESRINRGSGFCATNSISEKARASTEYSEALRTSEQCTTWNEGSSDIIKREVARILTNNPSVTNIGTESAFRDFCGTFYSPAWRSINSCVDAFMKADTVKELMNEFCNAVTSETEPCVENLEVIAEEGGYKEAFREGYETFVVSFESQCEIKFGDLPASLEFNEDKCETGVELQFYNPRLEEWVTYAAFPANNMYCTGYKVKALYDYHPKLFKNPLRFIQKHDTAHCNQCTQVASVQASLRFEA